MECGTDNGRDFGGSEALPSRALVVVADVVNSRKLPPEDRRRLQAYVRGQGTPAPAFRFTGGDEFEWRLDSSAEALDRLLLLRTSLGSGAWGGPAVFLRMGLGVGAVTVVSPEGPYAEEGEAFHRARHALERLKEWQVRRHRVSSRPFEPGGGIMALTALDVGEPNPVLDALLLQMDAQMGGWTQGHWEVIHGLLEGMTQGALGEKLGITQQAVAVRLRTADLDRFLVGHQAVRGLLEVK